MRKHIASKAVAEIAPSSVQHPPTGKIQKLNCALAFANLHATAWQDMHDANTTGLPVTVDNWHPETLEKIFLTFFMQTLGAYTPKIRYQEIDSTSRR